MRAACPSTSGREANSTTFTVITPSAGGMGGGNGSSLVWADAEDISSSDTTTRVKPIPSGLSQR